MPEIHIQTGVGRLNFKVGTPAPVQLNYTAITVVGVGTVLIAPLVDTKLWRYIAPDGKERIAVSQREAVMEALGLTTLPEWIE